MPARVIDPIDKLVYSLRKHFDGNLPAGALPYPARGV